MNDLVHADGAVSLVEADRFEPLATRARKVPLAPVAALDLGRGARSAAPAWAEAPARAAGGLYRTAGKRFLDIALTLALLPLAVPVIALCALCLAVQGQGIFFTQLRLGRGGRSFRMLKLRTMVPNADALLGRFLDQDPALREEWDRTQKLVEDPRITPVGRLLRRTSLDELPQLWHVLTGEMSLVGPRPMLPSQMNLYGDARSYHALRPGITGLWQVMERTHSTFTRRAQLDRTYDENLTLAFDIKMILKTFGAVLCGTGR